MKKPLIIYFNDEKMVKSATDHSKFLKKMNLLAKGNSLPVSSIEDFGTLINNLADELNVFVFIHIMGDALGENIPLDGIEFQGKSWAISLKQEYPNCNFLFVTSNLTQTTIEIYDGIPAHNITDLMDKIFVKMSNEFLPQKVREIKSLDTSFLVSEISSPTNESVAVSKDIVILTALVEDEYNSFKNNMDGEEKCSSFIGKFKEANDYKKEVTLVSQLRMGMVDSSITTKNIYKNINPKVLILAGVCGGRKEKKVKLYDIIIPKNVIDIITGRYENGEFIPYGYNEKINEALIDYIEKITTNPDFVLKEMYNLIPNQKHDRENEIVRKIKIHYDVMACGAFVLKTDKFLDETAKKMNDKIVGFEMESYGVIRATEFIDRALKLSVVIKSVMDYTDSKKSDTKIIATTSVEEDIDKIPAGENIKAMAAYMSSICTRALLPHIEKFIKDNNI